MFGHLAEAGAEGGEEQLRLREERLGLWVSRRRRSGWGYGYGCLLSSSRDGSGQRAIDAQLGRSAHAEQMEPCGWVGEYVGG